MLRSVTRRGIYSEIFKYSCSRDFLSQIREYTAPINDMQFLIEEVFKFPERYLEIGYDHNLVSKEMITSILNETAKFADSELVNLDETGDSIGCQYLGPHEVKSPPGFKEAYDKYRQGDWVGLSFPTQFGGQDLPHSLSLFHSEILGGACQPWSSYPGLSKGAIRTLIAHGSKEVQDLFVRKLVSGEWTGTMCLTEPHCGSDLNQVSSRAVKLEDGRYSITGTKIFITCGEHDITPNIVHLVLARIPGGPPGTHGISLFAVPKHLVEDGEVSSEFNGVNIGRIEKKMGYHGTPTCEINFENAVGYLVGREHKGMAHMFTFMNGARIGVSMMGVNAAEKSFQNALEYSKNRRAFRAAKGNIDTAHAADPIIVHPDVRKMLLTQKAFAEGGRAMIYSSALMNDQLLKHMEIGDLERSHLLEAQLGFMTPILKGFLTERGIEAANLGIQIYGGHGYIKGNHQEQILRDTRISAIWEGTTGIQALDLLRRKVFGKGFDDLTVITSHCAALQELCKTIRKQATDKNVQRHSEMLFQKADEWIELTRRISLEAKKDPNALGLASVDYLMYSGYITLAEHWLIMEENASLCIANPNRTQTIEFYETKLKMANFVFFTLLPRVEHHKLSALAQVNTLMDIPVDHFSFDY